MLLGYDGFPIVSIPLREDILSNEFEKLPFKDRNDLVSIPLREDILSNDPDKNILKEAEDVSFNSPKGRYLI